MATQHSLSNEEIGRYSRQLILPEWGVAAQDKIKSSSVLIVGAGGLGCPVAQYLAAAGIGHIGVLDYDEVEISNLHRQVLHSERNVGVAKVISIKESINRLNSMVTVTAHSVSLNSSNAFDIMKQYDIIVDASDNVATRYLVNDGCVLLNKPLVSGSALRFEGQLTVYHHGNKCPCYRCLFPTPPPVTMVTNCSEGGVLGVVPGVIGSLQALEVLKIAAGIGECYNGRLLMYDGLNGSFRTIKLRERSLDCAVCGDTPTITGLIDYEQFCGSSPDDKEHSVSILDKSSRITCQDYKTLVNRGTVQHVLVDVREAVEYQICHLRGSINVPLKQLLSSDHTPLDSIINGQQCTDVFVICRRGNDSQVAVETIRKRLQDNRPGIVVKDLIGGLTSWSNSVDSSFPKY